MWRPDKKEWTTIKHKAWLGLIHNKEKTYPPIYTQDEVMEAGADAILKALRENGIIRIETIRDVTINLASYPFKKNTRGWLTLIPDD